MVGYGASIEEGHNRDISVAKQADYLAAWIGELATGPVILVGHDLGGGVAQILAVRHPELVEGLVLTNAICYDSWPIPGVKAMRTMAPMVGRSPDVLFHSTFSAFLHQGHDDRRRAKESIAEHWPYYEEADGAAAFVRQIRSLNVDDTLAVADRIPPIGFRR
jgi:pimeloyl-ACP methyl ester carboxylesterase